MQSSFPLNDSPQDEERDLRLSSIYWVLNQAFAADMYANNLMHGMYVWVSIYYIWEVQYLQKEDGTIYAAEPNAFLWQKCIFQVKKWSK